MTVLITQIRDGILEGNVQAVRESVEAALKAGENPAIILNEGMILAMREVGKRFEQGEYFVPEMLISARAMKEGLILLRPHISQEIVTSAGKVILGTVKGDLHDIGKNLVGMMFEGGGLEVQDLGTDVTPEKFIEAIRANEQSTSQIVLGMSALLTTTMPNMQVTIDAINAAGLRDRIKVIVGGAPVTEEYARQIGADGYAADASRAVTVATALIK
jgi:5-methyltetrahydrofolate--homocysteine methyltransferase